MIRNKFNSVSETTHASEDYLLLHNNWHILFRTSVVPSRSICSRAKFDVLNMFIFRSILSIHAFYNSFFSVTLFILYIRIEDNTIRFTILMHLAQSNGLNPLPWLCLSPYTLVFAQVKFLLILFFIHLAGFI